MYKYMLITSEICNVFCSQSKCKPILHFILKGTPFRFLWEYFFSRKFFSRKSSNVLSANIQYLHIEWIRGNDVWDIRARTFQFRDRKLREIRRRLSFETLTLCPFNKYNADFLRWNVFGFLLGCIRIYSEENVDILYHRALLHFKIPFSLVQYSYQCL